MVIKPQAATPLSNCNLRPSRGSSFQDLTTLTNRQDSILTNLDYAPPALQFTEPGRAIVAWQLAEWKHDEKTIADWNQISAELEAANEVLQLIQSAARKPGFDNGFDYQKGFVDFQIGPLVKVKQAAQIMTAATIYGLKKERFVEAHTNLCACVSLVAVQKSQPLVICQLVRYASAALAFSATWQALQASGWSERQLATLQSAWERSDFISDLEVAMEMERALTLDFYKQIRSSET